MFEEKSWRTQISQASTKARILDFFLIPPDVHAFTCTCDMKNMFHHIVHRAGEHKFPLQRTQIRTQIRSIRSTALESSLIRRALRDVRY